MTFVHCSPRVFQEGRIGSVQYTTDYKIIIHVPTLEEVIHTCSKFFITTHWLWEGPLTFPAQLPCV